MERTISRESGFGVTLLPALVMVSFAFAMIVIAYGVDSVAPGVHDAFHDFRHVIGMACH